jgi:Protein of unknown function (DUF2865)
MRASPPRTPIAAVLLIAAGALLALGQGGARAQGWGWWPWSQPQSPPVPREPIYRQPPPAQLPPGEMPGQPPPGPGQPQAGRANNNICLQLEQRLVGETQASGQGRDQLPRLESDMRQLEKSLQVAQMQLDRADCWDQFLFSKTLRRTQRCIQLNAEVENTRQRLADLDAQRRQIMGRSDRSYQDDIIHELARNGCGPQYVQEARRRDAARNPFASLFGGEEEDAPRTNPNQFGNLPFATYRTLCVRLCDGYYFPVSFSTLPNHFTRDAEQCQAQCAAPAELYYHQNPGGAVEQMVSAGTQQPYTSLKTAWRYRKEFIQGCSCKASEYVPQQGGEKRAEAPARDESATTARLNPR